MSSEWPEVELSEVVGAVNTGLDAIKRAPIVEHATGVKCLRIQDISQQKPFSSWGNTEVTAQNFEKFQLKKNEIIMARTCSPGICLLVHSDVQAVFNNGLARIRPIEQKISPAFLLYIFKSKSFADYIYGISHGTSVQLNMKVGDLTKYRLRLPPLHIQHEIASLLELLDYRITLLREANATLESIAQALFKSWFVDFDPVRAKQEGRTPEGMDEAQAALFPDGFEKSEKGTVPKGWRIGKVEDLMELAYGKSLKSTDRISGPIPVYGSGGVTGFHNEPLVEGPSIIIGRKGTVGSLYWEDRPFFPIDTVFYVRTQYPMTYCYYTLQTLGLEDMNTDGAVPGLNRSNVYRLQVPIPSDQVLASFNEMVSALRVRIFSNNEQAQTLSTIRDTLLPRLISGQLRLPEAEALEA